MLDFDALWDYNQPEETEQKFISLLMQAEGSGNIGYLAELLTQIARSQGLQAKCRIAHETLDRAERLLKEDLVVARIRYFLERGRVFNSSSRSMDAIPLFLNAWELGIRSSEDYYAVDAAHMLGIAESTPEKRMEWNLKALDYAEKSPKASCWLGSLYNNIGWAQVENGKLEEALELFKRALEFRKVQGTPNSVFIAKWSVAKVLRLMGQVDESFAIQMELLAETEQNSEPDGYVYEEVAECLLLLKRSEEARQYFSFCYDRLILDNFLATKDPERIERIKELAGRSV
ncbi:tetratricopeptide repeat protein [Peribacillus sp. TH16]|uniref:tetratricopeptide repeat protein n=1 Tax=Peribacillus sp. TH16 TaxID=2798482 RepID=UPI001914CAAF|nr:tetratricopeptide repeat protein [Peribacillus sp. TH16]MBK5481786.1 tetratricopeptide repeat protein [Peribacillus sp. TH16]